jgi:uncharacterized membrane protein
MSKDVIILDGKEVVVREDTAKAFRGVHWMIMVLIAFIVIVLLVAATFFMKAARTGNVESPSQIENTNHP